MRTFRAATVGLLSVGVSALLTGCAAPQAQPDTATVSPGGSTTIDVLANDHDPNHDPLIIKRAWGAQKGDVQINPDNTLTYNAHPGEIGTDSFQYRVKDNHGHASNSNVVVRIEPRQEPYTSQVTIVPVPMAPPPAPVIVTPPPAIHATPEPVPTATPPLTPPAPPAGTPMIQSILVTLHTTDDDKNREDAIRVVLRRGQEVVADRTFGVGELWGSDSDRAFEIPLKPEVPITDSGLLNLDVHKPPVGTAAGAGWAMQISAQAHLSDGRTITLLPQTQPMKLGDGQPNERSWTIPPTK